MNTSRSEEPPGYFPFADHARLRSLTSHLAIRARRRMFDRFMEVVGPSPTDRVLDVGVTPDITIPASNYFEQLYPYIERITASSVEDASNLELRFPGLRFVKTSGVDLPFGDREFDVVFSSAVIEHVGSTERQRAFLAELVRVGRKVFLLTPNRWFPVDPHTMIPLAHWLPRRQHQAILRACRQDFWASTDNLNLLSKKQMAAMFPVGTSVEFGYMRTAGWPSHLVVYAM